MAKAVSAAKARRKFLNSLWSFLPIPILWLHVLLAPYTKVEESFTLHAIHDVLSFPLTREGFAQWDHLVFPGAVPRSFFPSLILGLLSWPIVRLGDTLGLVRTSVDVQICVRLLLASLHTLCLNQLSRTIRQRYGASPRKWFMALTLTQFHNFYAGRPLPNFMVYPTILLSLRNILKCSPSIPAEVVRSRIKWSIILLTGAATVVRLELALFVLPLAASLIAVRRLRYSEAILYGMIGGFGSLALSAPIDYQLWKPTLAHPDFPFHSPWQIVWPELTALTYNIFQGHASDWGTRPWYYYLLDGLPRLTLASLPLTILGLLWLAVRKAGLTRLSGKGLEGVKEVLSVFGLSIVGLVGGMSLVGHKEWRFIVYVVPVLNVIAALTSASLWNIPRPRLRPLTRLMILCSVFGNVAVTGLSTWVSRLNYPGGEVWRALEELQLQSNISQPITVYLTECPTQTGASLFTLIHTPLDPRSGLTRPRSPPWAYLREHSLSPAEVCSRNVDYVVTENWAEYQNWPAPAGEPKWEVRRVIDGFVGFRKSEEGLLGSGIEIRQEPQIAILARRNG